MFKSLIVLIVLSFAVQSFATEYKVGVTASGSGNGSSWANKDDWATFNHAGLNPGDIVDVDGGAGDSLLYTGLTFNTAANGTSGNPIIYRRSTDSGHNGRPVFYTTSSGYSYHLATVDEDYVTIDGLQFMVLGSPASGYETMAVYGSHNIIQNCVFYATNVRCIRLFDSQFTSVLDSRLVGGYPGSSSGNCDQMYIGGSGAGGDLTIDGCEIINLNTNSSNGNHKDNIQSYLWQTDGTGTTTISNTFFYSASSGITANTILEMNAIGGRYNIVNNVFVCGGNASGRVVNLSDCDEDAAVSTSVYMCNNTFFINGTSRTSGYYTDLDSFYYKNNLIYYISGEELDLGIVIDDITLGNFYDLDYNVYVTTAQLVNRMNACEAGGYTAISTTTWRNTYGQDTHSQVFTSEGATGIDFEGSSFPSTNPQDYRLASGSTGIGDGVNLSSLGLSTTDFNGNARGSTWDIGAFQYGASPPAATKKVRVIIIQ